MEKHNHEHVIAFLCAIVSRHIVARRHVKTDDGETYDMDFDNDGRAGSISYWDWGNMAFQVIDKATGRQKVVDPFTIVGENYVDGVNAFLRDNGFLD